MDQMADSKKIPDRNMTHQEIADALGMTRGTISQIEERAMKKVKKIIKEKKLKSQDFFDDKDDDDGRC
jgi:DNA-directed RNA polymerase sigma subunit (sigma70/sigma32)